MTSSNNNINNLVNHIIFPPNMELRKIRKKRKKSDGKKKAKDSLKEVLKEYDTVLNNAKQQKVNLPQQLGVLPTALPQINSIREMNDLTQDLRGRVLEINSLIAEKRDEPTPEELRIIRLRKIMGLSEPEPEPEREPEPSMQPEPEPSMSSAPSESSLVPVPSIGVLSEDQQSEISNIEREIMESQNPVERAKLETRLKIEERARKAREQREKEAEEQNKLKEQLADPNQFLMTNLQTDGQGNFTNKIIVPVGFDELWNQIRMLYENIIFDFTQGQVGLKGDEYRLDELKYEDLKKNQEDLRNQFNNYLEGLNPLQRDFLERKIFPTESGTARQFIGEMKNILNTDFKIQFIQHLKSIGVTADPQRILIGAEKTAFQQQAQQQELKDDKLEKEKKDYENKLFKIREKFTNFQTKKVNPMKAKGQGTSEEINTLLSDLEKIKTELDELNLREESQIIKEIYLADYNEAETQYSFIRNDLIELLPPPVVQPQDQPPSYPPPQEDQYTQALNLNDEAPPNYKLIPEQEEALKRLKAFKNKPIEWNPKTLGNDIKILGLEKIFARDGSVKSKQSKENNKKAVSKVIQVAQAYSSINPVGRPSKIPQLLNPIIDFINDPKKQLNNTMKEIILGVYQKYEDQTAFNKALFANGKPLKPVQVRANLKNDLISRGIPSSQFTTQTVSFNNPGGVM